MKNKELIVDNGKLTMEDWEEKKIKEIAFTQSGGTPRRSNKSYWNGNIPWLKSGELNDNLNITENTEFITKKGLENSSAKLFPKGTLLLAMYGATAGKLGVLGIDATTNQAVCSIQNKKGLFEEKFLFNFLLFKRDEIIRDSFGGAQPNISKTYIDNIKIPLPPLPEQRRIVSKLDGLFAEIDASLALIDQNIEQAEALKLSVLDEEFGKIRKKENIFKIEEIAFTKSGATPRRSNKEYWNGNIPWLKSGELNDNKNIFQNTEFITQKGLDNSSAKLFPKGTLLMAMYGATAGKLGILGMEACTNQAVCSIQNNKDFFVEEYLYYYLLMIREQIILDSFGGAQPNISKKYIDNLEVPFPKNKETQQKIVQKLDSLFEEIDGLISDYQQKRDNLEALKSSLLDRAFKGEL